MRELSKTDMAYVISHVPKDIREIVAARNLIIGGGFIRAKVAGEVPSDIDIFGPSVDVLNTAIKDVMESRKGCRVFTTKNATTILDHPRMPIQFITRWLFSDPVMLCESFDYTICQVAVFFKDNKWQSVCSDEFYQDLAARRLHYTFPKRNEDAGGSLLRMKKFVAKGYNIQPYSMAGVIARLVSRVDFTKRQMEDERWLASVLTGLLREVDPLTIIDGVDMPNEDGMEE